MRKTALHSGRLVHRRDPHLAAIEMMLSAERRRVETSTPKPRRLSFEQQQQHDGGRFGSHGMRESRCHVNPRTRLYGEGVVA